MKLKLSVLAGALALAVTGQANAAIVDMNNATGSDLVLSVWDTVKQVSYTRDLGINMSTFVAGVAGTATALTADSSLIGNLSYAADANLTNFLATATAGSTIWNVTAGKYNGAAYAFKNTGYLTTTNDPATAVQGVANSLLVQAGSAAAAGGYFTAAGATMAAGATSAINPTGTGAYAGSTQFGTNFGSNMTFNNTATVGNSMNFWYLTPSGRSTSAMAAAAQFGTAAGVSSWTLASNGTLAFAAAPVAAVPEPGEWLLMLSGFGLIGFIAMRRKDQNTSMTFA